MLPLTGCNNTTETLDVDDFVDTTVSPNPVTAMESTDGKTYRVVRGNDQPDDILVFKWKASFSLSVTLNNNATSDSIDVTFPVQLTTASIVVSQASGGVVSPPTGGEVEHYDSLITSASGKEFSAVNSTISMSFDVWYTLPSGGKEAVFKVTLTLVDDDGVSFTKTVDVLVNP